jgi:hypothetical protein
VHGSVLGTRGPGERAERQQRRDRRSARGLWEMWHVVLLAATSIVVARRSRGHR